MDGANLEPTKMVKSCIARLRSSKRFAIDWKVILKGQTNREDKQDGSYEEEVLKLA